MRNIFLTFSIIVLLSSCSSGEGGGESGDNYNRTAMLENWADNIIVPAFQNYQSKVTILVADASAFSTQPTHEKLEKLRGSWLQAYIAYQSVGMYNFGKSEDLKFKEYTNTFPADATGIQANIDSETPYNLSVFSQFSRQGFPGLDYIINGLGADDAAILAFYTTHPKASKYKMYLTDLTARLKSNADAIVSDWSGGYRDAYVQNNGNTINSSVNKTINNFVKYFELDIRSGKVGIPAGLFSNGTKFPEKVEAVYKNDVSKELFLASVKASRDFFNGKYFNTSTTGASIKSYLDYLGAIRNSQELSVIIDTQFGSVIASSLDLTDSFSQQILSDNSKMTAAYDTAQQNLVYLKLDMMQALNITVDYVDSDGD